MELFEQLGINWKLFLGQAFNFFILLVILRFFVYKPVLNIIKERNRKIKEGLEKAEEAGKRLGEVDQIAKEKIKQAQEESMGIVKATQIKAKEMEHDLQIQAEARQKDVLAQVERSRKLLEEESKSAVLKEAAELVRKAIIKTVELDPDRVDEALIKKAVSQIKNEE